MAARNPEDLDRLFAGALNTGNIEELMGLYEPQASLMASPGKVVAGSDAIREALRGFLDGKPKMSLSPRVVAKTADLALTTSKWELTMTGPDGKLAQMSGQSIEVAHRGSDGNWRFAIDLPFGVDTPQG
ncbi:MAG TPA: SgcJ/EcaC family oxidoreductase [Casimicrobiaceae bacterium]|jgi:uncharacterized protein (TIGR02246 family)